MYAVHPEICANRASRIVEQAMRELSMQFALQPRLAPFSYWDEYYGLNPNESANSIRLVPHQILQQVDSKLFLARQAKHYKLEGTLLPYSFETVVEAQSYNAPAAALWFIKPIYSSGGRGIQCVANHQLNTIKLLPHHLLQEQITDLELIQDRKYTARAYVFIFNKQLYCFDNGFVMIHGVPYDPTSMNHQVQVDHADYHQAHGLVKMLTIADLPRYTTKMQRVYGALQQLRPLLAPLLNASSCRHYALIGVDLLFQRDDSVKVVELNTKANFVHTEHINESLNVPFFKALLSRIYLQSSHRRLIHI